MDQHLQKVWREKMSWLESSAQPSSCSCIRITDWHHELCKDSENVPPKDVPWGRLLLKLEFPNHKRWISMFKISRSRKSWLKRQQEYHWCQQWLPFFKCSYVPSTVLKVVCICSISFNSQNKPLVALSPFLRWENQGSGISSNLSR